MRLLSAQVVGLFQVAQMSKVLAEIIVLGLPKPLLVAVVVLLMAKMLR